MIIREISLDTEFLEAGRNPVTQAAQIMPASIALVDVFNKNAFYGVAQEYTTEHVEKLLLDPQYSTLPAEDPDLAKRLLSFQKSSLLPKIMLDDHAPNSLSSITLNSEQYALDYRHKSIPDLGQSLLRYLERTKSDDETHIRFWARQGASDQIVTRAFFNALLTLKEQLKDIGYKLMEGEVNDLPNKDSFIKPPEDVAHNCLYDAAYDALNISAGLD